MNKTTKRILTLAMALVLCLSLAAPALASPAATPAPSQPINTSGSVQFDKDLTTNQNAVLPANLVFTFKLTALEANTANSVGGWISQTASTTGVTVTNAQGTTAGDVDGTNLEAITVTYRKGENSTTGYTKGFVVNFSITNGGFSAPGVYRYKVEEISKTDPRVTYGTQEYYIDVFVQWNTAGTALEIANIVVMPTGSTTYTPDSTTVQGQTYYDNKGKVDGTTHETTDGSIPTGRTSRAVFTNNWKSYDLSVTKNVTGNQGDKNKYFTFTLSDLAGPTGYALPDGEYTVVVGSTGSPQNEAKFTVSNGSISPNYQFTLKNGESITIKDLPYGTTWKVEENDYTSDGYTTTSDATEAATAPDADDVIDGTRTVNDLSTGIKGTTSVTFTNDKSGTIPTGVLLTVAPFAAMMLIGLLGAVVILKKKHN